MVFRPLESVTDGDQKRSGGIIVPRRPNHGKYPSLGHCLLDKLSTLRANTIVYIESSTGREWTGLQLKERILNTACALKDLHSFEPGTEVFISYHNSVETITLAYAVVCLGGVVCCPLSKDPYEEVLYLARKVDPKYLFCREINLPDWGEKLAKDLGHPIKYFSMDGDSFKPNLNELFNYDSSKSPSLSSIPVPCKDPTRDVAYIIQSSGTTGYPKAVPTTHDNVVEEIDVFHTMENATGIRMACASSLDYISGRWYTVHAILEGYTCVIIEDYSPEKFLKQIGQFGINSVSMGAASMYALITNPMVDKCDLSSLRYVTPTGAKITYFEEFKNFLAKNPQILEVDLTYGSSEMCACNFWRAPINEYLKDPLNLGPLMAGFEGKIVDTETGEVLTEPNQKGMFHCRGPAVFPGYYDIRLKQSGKQDHPFICDSSVFDDEGYYITGDIAWFNERKELYVEGRMKELMIVRGPRKVLPYEFEDLLQQHPAVAKVCVLGFENQNKRNEHCPRAFITIKKNYYTDEQIQLAEKNGNTVDELATLKHKGEHKLCSLPADRRRLLAEDIMEFFCTRISWMKHLTGGIVILDVIPVMERSGKFDKNYLKSLKTDRVEIYGDRSSKV